MLETVLGNLWNLFLIVLTITAIIFLTTLIINIIFGTIDTFKKRKMQNETLETLQRELENNVKKLGLQVDKAIAEADREITEAEAKKDVETPEKPEKIRKTRKSTKKLDKENKD